MMARTGRIMAANLPASPPRARKQTGHQSTSSKGGAPWTPDKPIRFGPCAPLSDHSNGQLQPLRSPINHTSSTSKRICSAELSSQRTSISTTPRLSNITNCTASSWRDHRFISPSPSDASPSNSVESSTARFSPLKDYARVPEVALASHWTALTHSELEQLVAEIDFSDLDSLQNFDSDHENEENRSEKENFALENHLGETNCATGLIRTRVNAESFRSPLPTLPFSYAMPSSQNSCTPQTRFFSSSANRFSSYPPPPTDDEIALALSQLEPVGTARKAPKSPKMIEIDDDREEISLSSDSEIEILSNSNLAGNDKPAPYRPKPRVPTLYNFLARAKPPQDEKENFAPDRSKKLSEFAQKRTQLKLGKLEKDEKMREKFPIEFKFSAWGKPKIIYSTKESEIEQILNSMTGPLGFDLEWPPSTRRGVENKTALVQVCDERTVLLAHICKMPNGESAAIRKLAEDGSRVKLGVQIAGDARKLLRDFGYVSKGLLELNNVGKVVDAARYKGRNLIGLQELCGVYLDRYLPKGAVRSGDWSKNLSLEQKNYAANDVVASLHIFKMMSSLAKDPQEIFNQVSSDLKTASTFRGAGTTRSGNGDSKSMGTSVASTPTPRAAEAWTAWHEKGKSIETVASEMGIKPVSILLYLLKTLGTEQGSRYENVDEQKLLAAVDFYKPGARMLHEHEKVLNRLRESVGK